MADWPFTVEPMTASIGAEIGAIDLRDDLPEETIDAIREALLDWKVLFFRDQDHLDRSSHVAFGRRFGALEVHPLTPDDQDHPEVFVLPAGGEFRAPDVWHSDVTWRPEPSMGSILRAVKLPDVGGDTLWADMAFAYDLLSDELKARIDGLVGLHDYTHAFGRRRSEATRTRMREEHPTVEHPVVRTHPETKRKTLYVNGSFTIGIKDMDDAEAQPLLRKLWRQATIPDVQCRFRWRPGSIAFWDNRATQHCVSNDFLPNPRVMERVTIAGDRPF